MARDWGNNGSQVRGKSGSGCSYRRTTLVVCSINIVVALYVLRRLYASVYVNSSRDSASNVVKYTPDQIRVMEESVRRWKASEPVELTRLVKQLENKLYSDETVELPPPLKRKIADQILQILKGLNASATICEQREAVESWRKEKLREVNLLIVRNMTSRSTFSQRRQALILFGKSFDRHFHPPVLCFTFSYIQILSVSCQAGLGILKQALGTGWAFLSEEIGLWIPMEVVNKEHDDKPEDEEEIEEEVLPGGPLPPECNAELHTDYDGMALRWGLTHHKESAADCCQACLDQAKYAKPGEKKCNIWVYCPSETGCYSPDIYEHKNQECWLKYTEKPKLNFKDRYSEPYRNAHPNAPLVVPWASGVIG